MFQEVYAGVFRILVPLPGNPLKFLNSYLIKGTPRSLLIDTGFAFPECKNAVTDALNKLDVKTSNLDFFITHMHSDHAGQLQYLVHEESTVYMSAIEADLYRRSITEEFWLQMNKRVHDNGFPQEIILNSKSAKKVAAPLSKHITPVGDGSNISIGNFVFSCVSTPGHTTDHLCLHDEQKSILFSGDHLLQDITPTLTDWNDMENPLGFYLNSLDRIDSLNTKILFPGHRETITDPRKRIAEMRVHHQKRLQEILDILENNCLNAFEIASQMHWDTRSAWDDLPKNQLMFASGEAMAHLVYLESRGKVQRIIDELPHRFILSSFN